jgi:hypothetical protein
MRVEYFACTVTLFVVAFILYGCIGSMGNDMILGSDKLWRFFGFGMLGGYGFSSILSGIILFSRFITKKDLRFKILSCALFPITFGVICYVGVFSFIPYSIYNLVKMVKGTDDF